MIRIRYSSWVLVATSMIALAAPALAAPRDELIRLVPDDVGFIWLVQDLRTHCAEVVGSPFFDELRSTPVGKAIAQSPEATKLRRVNEQLKTALNMDAAELRDNLFGDAFLLAYRPPLPDQPEREQGLFMLRAKDAATLADLVERLNKAQKDDGAVRDIVARKHAGETYYQRVERDATRYYIVRGPVLAFSSSEDMIKLVIEQAGKQVSPSSIVVERWKKLGIDAALSILWVNPRAFDADLADKVKAARDTPELPVVQKMQSYWKALDGIAYVTTLRASDVQLGLHFLAREGDLPPGGKQLFAVQTGSSELWQRFPESTLAAAAGQIDAKALSEFFSDFLPEMARQKLKEAIDRGAGAALGVDVVKDVLPNLGPDWGFCLLAPGDDKIVLPTFLTALKVSPGKGNKPIDQALLSGLNSLAFLAVLGNNNSNPQKISLASEMQGKIEVKYLTGDAFPPSFRPAFALKEGYLLLASSPDAIRQFGTGDGKKPSDGLLGKVNLQALGAYLKKHQGTLATQIAERQNLEADEVSRRLDGLLTLCHFVDAVELNRKAADGQLSLLLTIKTAKPLKK